jgi:cell division protein FtsL
VSTTTPRLASVATPRRASPLRITVPRREREIGQEPAGAEKRRPDLRIVPRLRRRRAGVVALLVCVVVFGVMLGLVAFQAKIAADQQRLDRIDQQTSNAQTEYERLRVIVAQLESPQTVISAAEGKGMVVPDNVTYITPSMNDVLGVALAEGRATATTTSGAADDATSAWEAVKPYVGATP